MYRQCPTAIIAAREEEALTHGQVMYGLIKPTKDMDQVESTAAMVNVIPKKRIYRMEKHEEIDLFLKELMKRPLVLQPSAFIGRGVAAIGCTFCTNEEKWIILINQDHPKIKGRLQMGIETAKSKMAQGEPFVLKLTFNEFLKRVYLDQLTRTALDARFTFIDFEDAEIVIRYPGDPYHRSLKWELKSPDIEFSFEDLLPSEVTRRTVNAAQGECRNPALRIVMPDELLTLLPGWKFEMIDPLEGVEDADEYGEEEATGGIDVPEETPLAPSAGRIIGRSQRKAKASAQNHHVPVELHVPEPNGPQKLHRGGMPPSPVSPSHRRMPSPSQPYEDLNRSNHINEHAYERAQVHQSRTPPQLNLRVESPYEEMNMRRQQYSPGASAHREPTPPPAYDSLPPSYSPKTPTSPRTPTASRTPTSPRTPTALPKSSTHSPHSPQPPRNMNYSPQPPHSPRSPNMNHPPRTPNMNQPPRSPNMNHPPRSPSVHQPPHTPSYNNSRDRYNSEAVNSVQSSRQTYLTDDNEDNDDGGFAPAAPRGQHTQHKYDTNYNRSAEQDRYGNQYMPSDQYADQNSHPVPSPRGNFPPSSRPVLSPRGLHHHQGSGRSDTSASDSGFGESDEAGKYRNDRNSSLSNTTNTPSKTPYYNHAFQQESPERDRNVVDDIMAKHKAIAAQMMTNGQPNKQGQLHPAHGRQDYYREDNYGRELQKWGQNISDLREACDVPQSDFRGTRFDRNSNRDEKVEESFI